MPRYKLLRLLTAVVEGGIQMKQAVKFAREILRKEQAIGNTNSNKLKRDYRTALHREREELAYYCQCKGLSAKEVYEKAKEEVNYGENNI